MQVRKQQLEPDREQQIGSKLGKRSTSKLYIVPLLILLLCRTHLLQNAGLDESQARIKIAGKNINNLKYVDDTSLMVESEEELKSLLMRVKEERERASLKLKIKKKTKIMASGPITSWQIEGENVKVVTDFLFLGSKITVTVTEAMNSEDDCFLEGKL